MPRIELLGGGFTYFFMFTPTWGRFPFWSIFSKWAVQPPTRWRNTGVFWKNGTVDGRNPAPVDIENIPCFIGFQWISYITGGAGFLPSTVWMNLTSSSKIWCVRLGNTGNTLQFQVVLFQWHVLHTVFFSLGDFLRSFEPRWLSTNCDQPSLPSSMTHIGSTLKYDSYRIHVWYILVRDPSGTYPFFLHYIGAL